MTAPAVSVVVPFLNAEATIGALLTGLRTQAPHGLGETEFIFVDNGSADAGRSIVEKMGLAGARVVDEKIRGVSAARNRGLREANGQIVAVIDSDCVPSRQWLRELVAPFSDGDVLLAAGGLASYPPRTAAQRFAAQWGLNDSARNVYESAIPFANGRNMAVRRSAAEAVGGWPEDMDRGDDVEFSYRVVQHFGCVICYRPLALVFHQDRASDAELWDQAHGYGRGMAQLYAEHPGDLPWGWPQRARRTRTTLRRRVGAVSARLAAATRVTDGSHAEFASYLANWDRSFWRGFDAERRSSRRSP
jgi:glycosyltransferase involved in cell wall biosynthesis